LSPPWLCPLPPHELAVPAQQRLWRHDQPMPAPTREESGERREEGTVCRSERGPRLLPREHQRLMLSHEEFRRRRLRRSTGCQPQSTQSCSRTRAPAGSTSASSPPSPAPAQVSAGIEPIRGLYDLRHTYATFALRAGVPVFAVSRFIGSSIAMIDRHYGHLAHDSHVHAVSLLDALAVERAVDATWTSNRTRATALSTAIRSRIVEELTGAWTLRGRRGSFLSLPPTTKGTDQQELPEAL